MGLTSTSPESAMAAKESANILLRTSSSISDSNESSKDSQVTENVVAHLQLEDTDSSQTAHATASDNIMPNSTISAHVTSATLPETKAAMPREPNAAAPTFMGLPTELRQRILYLVLSTFAHMSPENGSYVAQLEFSRGIRIQEIRRFTPSRIQASDRESKPRGRLFSLKEVASYLYMQNLYLLNRTVRAEMRFVEQAWLEQHKARGAAPLSLGAFAAWVAAPTPVNGILTLSLFNRNFIAHPPPEWEAVVRSIAADRHKQFRSSTNRLLFLDRGTSEKANTHWHSYEYLRAWREVVMRLPPMVGCDKEATVARRYGIEAVEIVDAVRCVLTPDNSLMEEMGLVHNVDMARLEILLMRKLGLQQGRVRVMDLMHYSDNGTMRRYPPAVKEESG